MSYSHQPLNNPNNSNHINNPNDLQSHHQSRGRHKISKKGLFLKDLPPMMFGFGDPDPQKDVVNLMEEIVIDHITDILISAHKRSTNRGKLKIDDIKSVLETSSTKIHNPISSPSSSSTQNSKHLIKYNPYPLARRSLSLSEKQLTRIDELLFMHDDLSRARGRCDDLKAYGADDSVQDISNYNK
ncbi:hypothetical protein O181_007142 [Austropuccinia psidii MF-1]|uniref:Transcription initiation factor TFIID subunit 13 n=1 Tax=Austropuccinia psidii MF-1 TaxID=1389203 RepID=A0A9Q3GI71_9BASI|nr:hypothetical protein [Austropuccinia psidii MF-1]